MHCNTFAREGERGCLAGEKLFSQDLSSKAGHTMVGHRLNLATHNLNELKKLRTDIIEKLFLELAGIQPTAKKHTFYQSKNHF